jgi:TRAP-type uncharacterized transport system fused permease subunit
MTLNTQKYTWLIAALSVLLVGFSIYTAAFGVFPDVIQRGTHLALALGLVYITAIRSENMGWKALILIGFGIAGMSAALYQAIFYDAVVSRYGAITDVEIWVAAAMLIILLDATRRTIGWSMVILALAFLAYAFWGNYLWGDIAHRGYGIKRVMSQVFLGADGVFGTPLGVSATFVILIVILVCNRTLAWRARKSGGCGQQPDGHDIGNSGRQCFDDGHDFHSLDEAGRLSPSCRCGD